MNINQIRQELTSKEIAEIDFRIYGNIVREATKHIKQTFNEEIVPVICSWLKDDRFADKLKITTESDYDWSAYKRQQREFTELQKQAATANLKAYREAIRKKRELRNELSRIIGTRSRADPDTAHAQDISTEALSGILEPFSPREQHQRELTEEFQSLLEQHLSNLIPWEIILREEIKTPTLFNDIKFYLPDQRQDRISKFQNLLQMATAGTIEISQESHEGDILITPCEANETESPNQDLAIEIKDKHGNISQWNWQDLSENQKHRVLTDTLNRKIICKSA
ncbi:hypothetical protein ACFL43_00420 [Thermodesulfobacteriota bacterium]